MRFKSTYIQKQACNTKCMMHSSDHLQSIPPFSLPVAGNLFSRCGMNGIIHLAKERACKCTCTSNILNIAIFRSLNHFVSISPGFTYYFSIQCRDSLNRIEPPPLPTRWLSQISIEIDINGRVLLITEIAYPVRYMRFRVMTSCHHFIRTLYRFYQTRRKQFSI